MNQNRLLPNEIADFVVANSDGLYNESDKAHIATYAGLHIKFGTLIVVRDKGDIIGVCRWNWVSPFHAKILDLIIRPDFRHKQISRNMLLKAKKAWPSLEHISFQRKKYAMRASSIEFSRWLKEKYEREIIANHN